MPKMLITANDNDIAPRFDACLEVVILDAPAGKTPSEAKTLVLAEPSAEEICRIVLAENALIVLCGGIDEDHYQYLRWKRVEVFDGLIGPWEAMVQRYAAGILQPCDIVR